jgi:hypothetical protein
MTNEKLGKLYSIDKACQKLDTGDPIRLAEIRNLRQIVHSAISLIQDNDPDATVLVKELMVILLPRVRALLRDPKSQGKHGEILKNNKPC